MTDVTQSDAPQSWQRVKWVVGSLVVCAGSVGWVASVFADWRVNIGGRFNPNILKGIDFGFKAGCVCMYVCCIQL